MTLSTERLQEAAQLADEIWADLDAARRKTGLTDVWAIAAEDAGKRILAFAESLSTRSAGAEGREAVDWQRADDALVSCSSLLKVTCRDEVGDVAIAELDYVRSAIRAIKENSHGA